MTALLSGAFRTPVPNVVAEIGRARR